MQDVWGLGVDVCGDVGYVGVRDVWGCGMCGGVGCVGVWDV